METKPTLTTVVEQIHMLQGSAENSDSNHVDRDSPSAEISINPIDADLTFDNLPLKENHNLSKVNEITSSPAEKVDEDYIFLESDVEVIQSDKKLKTSIQGGHSKGQKITNPAFFNKKITCIKPIVAPFDCSNAHEHLTTKKIPVNNNVESCSDPHNASKTLDHLLLHKTENKLKIDFDRKEISGSPSRVPISSKLSKQNTVTYSKSNPATNTNTIFNRATLHNPHKSHPIVVATKKLVSEVTQTTAKVSIGNTTISVPLLKPIISSHIISNECPKYRQLQQQSQNQQQPINSQTSSQLNSNKQPKILNIKRGHKLNPPTIVALSQLQMKSSTAGKIVQATVVGKKIQLDSTPNISNSKTDIFHSFPYSKVSKLTVVKEVSSTSQISEGESISLSSSESELFDAAEQYNSQKVLGMRNNDYIQKILSKHSDRCLNRALPTGLEHKANAITANSTFKAADSVLLVNTNDQMSFQHVSSENLLQLSSFSKSIEQNSNPLKTGSMIQEHKVPSLNIDDFSLPQVQIKTSIPTDSRTNCEKEPQTITPSVSGTTTSGEISSPLLSVPKTITMRTKKNASSNVSNVTPVESVNKIVKIINPSNGESLALSNNSKTVSTSVRLDASCYQPSPKKKVANIQSNMQIQIPLKRSKSTDDGFDYELEMASETVNPKKNLAEVPFSKRSNSLDTNVCSPLSLSVPSLMSNIYPHLNMLENSSGSNDVTNAISSASFVCTANTNLNDFSRNEEEQNVLLKKLLQNTSNQTSKTICSQTVPGRKVISVRAPSLGLVSSLEAQLARPVMPPVPTAASLLSSKQLKPNQSPTESSSKQNVPEFNEKQKQSILIISKETSFVSKPNPSVRVSPSSAKPLQSLATNTSELGASKISQVENKISNSNLQFKSTCNSNFFLNNENKRLAVTEIVPADLNKSITLSTEESFLNSVPVSLSANNLKSNTKDIQPKNTTIKISPNMGCESQTTTNKYCSNNHATDMKLSIVKERVSESDFSGSGSQEKCEDKTQKLDEESLGKSKLIEFSSPAAASLNKTHVKLNQCCSPKEVEIRKKRKREYQKQRRQLINNKESSSGLSKKRPRKLSKVEEDYDSFIDSLMSQMRQMPPLQVLEPLISKNFSICSLHSARDSSKVSNGKDHSDLIRNEILAGEFGSGRCLDLSDFYNVKPFGSVDCGVENDVSTIQNDFYDQEFSSVLCEDEIEKLCGLIRSLKEKHIEMTENILISQKKSCTLKSNIDYNGFYPGAILINEHQNCIGRMSPIIPLVVPFPSKKRFGLKEKSDLNITESYMSVGDSKNKKNSKVKSGCDTNRNLTVVLTLSMKAAENIVSVLRDLANILNLSTLGKYKAIDNSTKLENVGFFKLIHKTINNIGRINNKFVNIQKIINGTSKLCQMCDKVVMLNAIKANNSNNNFAMNDMMLPKTLYFCDKICYAKFKSNICRSLFLPQSLSNSSIADKEFSNATTGSEHFKPESSRKIFEKISSDKLNRHKYYKSNRSPSSNKVKKISEKEIIDILFKMNITVASNATSPNSTSPSTSKIDDTRQCIFCSLIGDGMSDGTSRLLNFDVDKWVHLNCALWSNGVYETISGGLMNLEMALQAGLNQTCTICHQLGATIKCFKNRCGNIYHLPCAMKEKCVFYKNKTVHCFSHALKIDKENELTTLSVQRRVYVERDESRQVAAVMHHSELSNLLRVGSLTFLNIGQLLPHQLEAFHTSNYIYPVGYKIIRFYWSMRNPNKRCRYVCTIAEVAGRPEFRIQVQEPQETEIELRDYTPKAVWQKVLEPIAALRKQNGLVQLFSKFITGEDLFGLTEPAIVRILESLPGIETLTDYHFKYGRNPMLELPLAINPSGSARTEPKQRQIVGWKKPRTQRTGSINNQRLTPTATSLVAGEVACPYSKQFVHSKSSQYKKMKQEWRNNVYLARSKIQGLGLYAARDLEKHTMVIEYIGEVIRTEVSELREKQYEAKNRGIYMFRLDEDRVVDATLSGGLARYINHSCNPNCVTEIVDVDREYRIIIFAKRRINRGEELSYDYKFDIEDDANKISCMCAAPNCRKWMN